MKLPATSVRPVRADRIVGAIEVRAARVVEADDGERAAGAVVEHELVAIGARERAREHHVPARTKADVREVHLDGAVRVETHDVARSAEPAEANE